MDRPAGRQGGRAEGPEEERRGVVARLSVGCRRRLEQKLALSGSSVLHAGGHWDIGIPPSTPSSQLKISLSTIMLRVALARPICRLPAACRLLSTSAARRRGDLDGQGMASAKDVWQKGKRDVLPPTGWDPSLVDRVVSTTAADVMNRPCVVSPKPDEMVHYVNDSDSVQASADVFWKKRIGGEAIASLKSCCSAHASLPTP
jgi:hypothetical protein